VRAVVDGEERSIPARIVVGADGATSAVARALIGGKSAAADRAVAIRAYLDGIETIPRTIELHWYARGAPGYAWIFPLGAASANVGVVVRADAFKRLGVPLDELLHEFLRAPDVRARVRAGAGVERAASWQLPYAPPRVPQRAFDGALLAGDAGRLVDPLTGEGIHAAVVSGSLAAEVVDRALARGDASRAALADYETRCARELGPLIRRAYRAQRLVAARPAVLEAVFFALRLANGPVTRWLDGVSTDFRVGPRPSG
jgi:flavin-dependent dehydrogenase